MGINLMQHAVYSYSDTLKEKCIFYCIYFFLCKDYLVYEQESP